MSNKELVVGIDLGTTFSAIAYVNDRGRPTIIRNAEGDKTTPSAVLIEDGQIAVGSLALNQALAKQEQVARWIKRNMDDVTYQFCGLDAIEISAEILKKLKQDAETELGVPIHKAVITCPAYFSAIEVENTKKAGELAGLEVTEIVREPTAAAVYYGTENLQDGEKLLVCDLGGGTYDASILALEDGIFKPISTAGDRQLGGHDWTSDLVEQVAEQLADIFGEDPRQEAMVEQMLYDTCEQVKRNFVHAEVGTIPCVFRGQSAQVTVTRQDFERMTEWRVTQVLSWTEKALTKVEPPLTWADIDHILLVGGSTRMRRIAEAIAELAGKSPIQTGEADTMVALGAAVLAKGSFRPRRSPAHSGLKQNVVSGLTLINFARTAPRNLGTRVIVRDNGGLCIDNSAIIPYGTELPVAKTRTDYQTSIGDQAFFDVPVVEFDDVGADVVQETWRFVCPPELAQGVPVHVTFAYDLNGQIEVTAVEQHRQSQLVKTRVPYEEPELNIAIKANTPRQIIFVLDTSGSMRSYHKMERAIQSVTSNAQSLLQAGWGSVQVGVVTFGSQAHITCPLTTEWTAVEQAMSTVVPDGMTAMTAGIHLALDMLSTADETIACEMVLVSDGMPDHQVNALAAGRMAQEKGVKLSLLGIGQEEIDLDFLQQMTPHYLLIEDAEGMNQALSQLLTLITPAPVIQSGITLSGGTK